jgi:hypothetical protein
MDVQKRNKFLFKAATNKNEIQKIRIKLCCMKKKDVTQRAKAKRYLICESSNLPVGSLLLI